MKNKHILLFEEFAALSEDLEKQAETLKNKKSEYPEKMKSLQMQMQDSKQKIASFKEKAAKTKDPLAQKIYTNRSAEEQANQQILAGKAKLLAMQSKMTDMELNTNQLKMTRKERDNQGG